MKKMTATQKGILKSVLVLASIALAAGLLLGIIYPLTRLSQAELDERAMKPLAEVYPAENGYEVAFRGDNGDYLFNVRGENTCIALAAGEGGYGGDVQMYVVISENKIVKLVAGANSETPGISDNSFNDKYYDRFLNVELTAGGFTSGKGDGQIDTSTGATKTATGILNAVNNAVKLYFDNYIQAEKLGDNSFRYTGLQSGSYIAPDGSVVEKMLELSVTVTDGKIANIEVGPNTTFSPPQWSPGLAEENLRRYYGIDVTAEQEIKMDAVTGATGTSNAVLKLINRIAAAYRGGLGQ